MMLWSLEVLIPHMAQGWWETVHATSPLRHSTGHWTSLLLWVFLLPQAGLDWLKSSRCQALATVSSFHGTSPFLTTNKLIQRKVPLSSPNTTDLPSLWFYNGASLAEYKPEAKESRIWPQLLVFCPLNKATFNQGSPFPPSHHWY